VIPIVPNKPPRPWDPDATRTGSVVLVVGLILSAVIHSGIPFAGMFWSPKSITQLPVTMEFESMPLPPAEELIDSPDEVDADGPDDFEPSKDPTPVEDPKEKPPTPDPPEPETPPIPDEPIVEEPTTPDPALEDTAPPPSTDAELKQRIAERDAKRAAWVAERAKRAAERAARVRAAREAREAARGKGKKGGAPESGDTQGTPEPVFLCNAEDKGQSLTPRTERSITSWMTIVPTAFAHFETRPGLADYISRLNQVYVPKKRLGVIDFAAPADVIQLPLEHPQNGRIAIGRLDARCMIGLKYRPRLFPIQLIRMPARLMRGNDSVAALVNITIFKDASLEIAPYNAEQPPLPFTEGRLKNSKAIARNIDDHFQAVRLANAFAELFGMKKASSVATQPSGKGGSPSGKNASR